MGLEYQTIRVEKEIVKLMNEIREKTGVPISRYVKLAVLEKMANDKKKKTT